MRNGNYLMLNRRNNIFNRSRLHIRGYFKSGLFKDSDVIIRLIVVQIIFIYLVI